MKTTQATNVTFQLFRQQEPEGMQYGPRRDSFDAAMIDRRRAGGSGSIVKQRDGAPVIEWTDDDIRLFDEGIHPLPPAMS